jgi:hypothetical protein
MFSRASLHDSFRHRVAVRSSACCDDDLRARAREASRDAFADSLTGTRNQRDSTLQIPSHFFSSMGCSGGVPLIDFPTLHRFIPRRV